MKKNIVIVACIAALFGLMGMGGNKEAAPVIGVIKSSVVFEESKLGKAGIARLEGLQKEAISKLETLQAETQKAKDAKDEAAEQRLAAQVQSLLFSLQNVLSQEQEKVGEAIRVRLEKVLQEYSKTSGLQGIFNAESLLAYPPSVDVTAAIISVLDKETLDFGPMPDLEAPAMPDFSSLDLSSLQQGLEEEAAKAETDKPEEKKAEGNVEAKPAS